MRQLRPLLRRHPVLGVVVLVLLAAVWWWMPDDGAPAPAQTPTHLPAAPATARPGGAAPSVPTGLSHVLHGTVTRVSDGDTVRLRTTGGRPYTLRLASIDAPERSQSERDRPGQPQAQAAQQRLEALVRGREVEARCYEIDQYGRDICDLVLADGQVANQMLVAEGLAWANREQGGRFLRDTRIAALEREARAARRGLWAEDGAVAPWVWRRDCWRQQRCAGAAAPGA